MTDEAFELRRFTDANQALVFFCDHAADAIPGAYGSLGLENESLRTHIAYDIGAGFVTDELATAYRAPAILARWSRLLIDLNRGIDDPTLVMKLSDGRIIPGTRHVDARETQSRIDRFHAPYHAAVAAEIAQARSNGIVPTLISMHSFTPIWKGAKRPWEVGVLWDKDGRLAKPLMAALARPDVAFTLVRDGKVARETQYFGDPFEPGPSRVQWVELMP